MRIRLTKVSGKPTSHIHVGYWVEGFCEKIEQGKSVALDRPIRTSSNEHFDWFKTTEVLEVRHNPESEICQIVTKNSTWNVS